jgi:hypothetical protein
MSPEQMKSARNLLPEEYVTQELAIKSFTELELEQRTRPAPNTLNPYNPKLKHSILQPANLVSKTDPFTRYIALSYPTAYYDPVLFQTTPAASNID